MANKSLRSPEAGRITLTREHETQIRALGAAIGLTESDRDYLIDRLVNGRFTESGRGAVIDPTEGETSEQRRARIFATSILENAGREDTLGFTPRALARAFVEYTEGGFGINLRDYTNQNTLDLLERYARRAGVDPDQLQRAFLTYRIISESPMSPLVDRQLREIAGYTIDFIASRDSSAGNETYDLTLEALTIACVRASRTAEQRPMYYLNGRRGDEIGIFGSRDGTTLGDLPRLEHLLGTRRDRTERVLVVSEAMVRLPTEAQEGTPVVGPPLVPVRVTTRRVRVEAPPRVRRIAGLAEEIPRPRVSAAQMRAADRGAAEVRADMAREQAERQLQQQQRRDAQLVDRPVLRAGTQVQTIVHNGITYTVVLDPELVQELQGRRVGTSRSVMGRDNEPLAMGATPIVLNQTDLTNFLRTNEPRLRIYRGDVREHILEYGEDTSLAQNVLMSNRERRDLLGRLQHPTGERVFPRYPWGQVPP